MSIASAIMLPDAIRTWEHPPTDPIFHCRKAPSSNGNTVTLSCVIFVEVSAVTRDRCHVVSLCHPPLCDPVDQRINTGVVAQLFTSLIFVTALFSAIPTVLVSRQDFRP